MSSGLYSGASGLALGTGLYKGISGLWSGASGLITGFGGGFSPASLFDAGEQGVWYDPSDFSTMYQERTGITPVTAVGQSVGFLGDKSQGFALGPDQVVNGDFATDSDWTKGTGWTISGGVAAHTGGFGILSPAVAVDWVDGRLYEITYDAVINSGSLSVRLGATFSPTARTATGTYRQWQFADSGAGIQIYGAFEGSITNISVRELPGNHATQATAASRPVLGRVPFGGRRNLLLRTEEFDNAAWTKVLSASATANTDTAPDGTITADTVVAGASNSAVRQTVTTQADTYTFSCWIKRKTGAGDVEISASGGSWVTQSLTTSWQRFSVTQSLSAGSNFPGVRITTSGDEVYVWGAQLELGSTATDYQKVVTAFDVTEAGVADCYYLSFDGTDDFMLTGTITPGTDKAQVFAGVRKLSDAAGGNIASLGNVTSTAGSFELRGPRSAAANYMFASRGTSPADANAGTFTAPITNVVTGLGDISADTCLLRVDGVQVAAPTTDQGTGNYANLPLYIGRLTGTALPFNGQLYSLIVRFGANLDAAIITQSENYTATKTGIYTVDQLNQFATLNASGVSYDAYGATDASSNNYLVPKTVLSADGTSYSVL